MLGHDELKGILNALDQDLSIVNVQVEFSLDSVVNQNARFQVNESALPIPVSLESDWNPLPAVVVHVSQSVPAALDQPLHDNVRLLLQVMVVPIGVVEATHRRAEQEPRGGLGEQKRTLHEVLHHFSFFILREIE